MAKQNSGGRFLKKNVKKRQAQSQSAQQHTTQPRAKTAPISKVVVVFTVLAVCVCLAASVFFLSWDSPSPYPPIPSPVVLK